jgi:hypothetical protein
MSSPKQLTKILIGELETPRKVASMLRNIPDMVFRKMHRITRDIEQKRFHDSLARNIIPPVIEECPRYILINGKKMARCIIAGVPEVSELGGYPPDLSPRFITELLNITAKGFNIAYNFKVIPIKTVDALKQMDDAVYYNAVNQHAFKSAANPNQFGMPSFLSQFEEEALKGNAKQIFNNDQRFFDTSLIITWWAYDEQTLDNVQSHIVSILNSNRIGYDIPYFRMKDTFIAGLPYPMKTDFTTTELFTNEVSLLVPTRNPNSRVYETGLYFGKNKVTRTDVIIDPKAIVPNHMLIIGASGSGKTYLSLMLLTRAHDMLHKRIIFIEPKDDVGTNYRAVAEYYGKTASIIDIGVGGKNINPLEIMFDEQSYKESGVPVHIYDQHADLLEMFFKTLFEDDLTDNQTSYLSDSLREVYLKKGIVRENPDTWLKAKKNKSFPTLLDLRTVWEVDAESDKSIAVTAQALYNKSAKMKDRWAYLNNQSDIDLSADFIVIDISHIYDSMKNAMHLFTTGIMAMQFRTDSKHETIIAVDEGAEILRNEKLAVFVLKTLAQGRSFNIGLWFITQHTSDLKQANIDKQANVEVAFKTDIPIKIVLGHLMDKNNIEDTKDFFKLDQQACNHLMACGIGEGLVMVGKEVIWTHFKSTKQENDMIKGNLRDFKPGSANTGYKINNPGLHTLIEEEGICFESWVDGDPEVLDRPEFGFEQIQVQNAMDRGTIRAWIKKGLIKKDNMGEDRIGVESPEHYANVAQVAGFLTMNNIPAKIDHNNSDLYADFPDKKRAFEFEIYSTNSISDLLEKKKRAEKTVAQCVFIGTTYNIKRIRDAVGYENAITRGIKLGEYLDGLLL